MNTTYDNNHQIEFSADLQYEFIKHNKRFKDQHLFETFLQAYDLNPTSLAALENFEKLSLHIKQIEKDHYCYPELIKSHGILHLLEQKQKNLQSPYLQEITDTKLANQAHLQQLIDAYFSPANTTLPIVEWSKFLLQQPRIRARFLPALNNTLFILVQQGFSSVTQVIKGMIDLGFPARNLIVYTKPHTSRINKTAFEQLRDILGFEYIQPDIKLNATQDNFDDVRNNGIDKLVDSVKARLRHRQAQNIAHVAIHDEGGKVLYHRYFLNEMATENPDLQFSISEHTVSGLNTRQAHQNAGQLGIAAACHTMATSWLKADKESLLIANASFKAVKTEIDALIAQSPTPPTIGVIGIGNIGSIFLEYLIKHYHGRINLILKTEDTANQKFLKVLHLASQQQMLNTTIYPEGLNQTEISDICQNLSSTEVIQQAKLVFSCAGEDVTKDCTEGKLNSESFHQVKIFSLSSAQREFKNLLGLLKEREELIPGSRQVVNKDFISSFQQLELTIKNFGKPIIFCDNIDGVVPHEIQLIRGLAICTAFQQLEYLSLLQTIQDTKDKTLIQKSKDFQNQRLLIKLDIALQASLWDAFCQFQRRYISIHPEEFPEPLLSIWNEFLSPSPATEQIIQRSVGNPFSIACQGFTPFNAIMRFDDNHSLHLSYLKERLELVFRKWEKEVVYDYPMLKKLLQPYFNLDEFYMACDFRKVQLISEKIIPRIENSIFKAHTIALNSEEKIDYVRLPSSP